MPSAHLMYYIIIASVECQIFMPLSDQKLIRKAEFTLFILVRFLLTRNYVYATLFFIVLSSVKKLFKAILKSWHSFLKQDMLR